MKRILLGLDIDGVLNPTRHRREGEPEIALTPVHYLNKILEAVPNCDVLITSSWGDKNGHTTQALTAQGFLYAERIVGYTRALGTKITRTAEVEHWMDQSGQYERIVCIDDESELFVYSPTKYGADRHNIVNVRADVGLDESKSYEAVCKLLGFNFRFWA